MDMEDDRDDNPPPIFRRHRSNSYSINSKIMLTAIISLSTIVLLVTMLHIYARWLLRRRRQAAFRQLGVITATDHQVTEAASVPKSGLDPTAIASIPVLVYGRRDGQDGQTGCTFKECSVCISMFEDGELIRELPNCKHAFHVECIDKWLGTISTCPICRTEARPQVIGPLSREGREPMIVAPPSAPPLECITTEGTSDDTVHHSAKVNGLSSRMSSFRRMLNRDRSSQRIQSCGQDVLDDVERQ